MNGKRRVVVTGMGVLSPIGLNVEAFWTGLMSSRSGAAPITYFDTALYGTHFGCELKGFKATDFLDRKSSQRMDPFAQYALITADMAVSDSGLSAKDTDPDRIGVIYGSGIGGMITYDTQFTNYMGGGPRRISPFFIPMPPCRPAPPHPTPSGMRTGRSSTAMPMRCCAAAPKHRLHLWGWGGSTT